MAAIRGNDHINKVVPSATYKISIPGVDEY